MKKITYLLMTMMLAIACTSQTTDSDAHLRVDDRTWDTSLAEAGETAQLIDVRTAGEYAEGHFDEALNMDVLEDEFTVQISTLDKTATTYVYCRSGGRSQTASEKMIEAGFTDVIELKSGYSGYSK
jgi:rhodanese-related sulfurtransferase